MSELKAFESERIYWAVEQVERVAGDIDSLHLDDNLFYIKSEVDKVIAEKDTEIAEQKDKLQMIRRTNETYQILIHECRQNGNLPILTDMGSH